MAVVGLSPQFVSIGMNLTFRKEGLVARHVTVTAERGTKGWDLECVEAAAAGRCTRLSQASDEMREAIAHRLGLPQDGFLIDVVPLLPGSFAAEMAAAEECRRAAQAAQAAAAAHWRAAARALADAGLSHRDIGTLMGFSHQRAGQLIVG